MKWLNTIHVNSYLEIGVRWGGNFIVNSKILKNNNPNIKLFACDIIPECSILYKYRKYVDFEYLEAGSFSDEFKNVIAENPIEFVYIDGDHLYEMCLADYELFSNCLHAKYIVFHDIDSDVCVDIKKIWNDVKNDDRFDSIEFIDQYPEYLIPNKAKYLGIGVLIRK